MSVYIFQKNWKQVKKILKQFLEIDIMKLFISN